MRFKLIDIMAYDDLLQQVDGKPFIRRMFMILIFNGFPNALAVTSLALIFFVPKFYHCALPDVVKCQEIKNATLDFFIPYDEEKQEYSKCLIYNKSEEEILDFIHNNFTLSDRNSSISSNLSMISCNGKYNFGSYNPHLSASMEFNYLCENAWVKPFLIFGYFAGKMTVSISGILSDKYGRRPVFILFTLFPFVAMFAESFAQTTWTFGFTLILCSLCSAVNFVTGFVLGAEYATPEKRNFITIPSFVSFSLGYGLASLIGYLTTDWRWMLRVNGIVGLVYIANIWLIPESPRWLLANGRIEEAKKVFKHIAAINNQNLTDDFFLQVEEEAKSLLDESKAENKFVNKKGIWKTFVDTWRSRKIILIMLVLVYSWFSINFIYYGIGLNVQSLAWSVYLNNALMGFVEIPGLLVTFLAVRYFSRPVVHGGAVICCAMFCLGSAMLIEVSPFAASVAALVGKSLISGAFYLVYIHTTEIFPTVIRNSYLGFLTTAGRLGSFSSPYLIHLGDIYGVFVTYVIMTAITASSGLATLLFSPKTNNSNLPESIEDILKAESGCFYNMPQPTTHYKTATTCLLLVQ